MPYEVLEILKFLAQLPEHVARQKAETETQLQSYASLLKGRLTHQYVCYAVAVRFRHINWRKALADLHAKGYTADPNTFRKMRVVSMAKTIQVVTEAGHRALSDMSGRQIVTR